MRILSTLLAADTGTALAHLPRSDAFATSSHPMVERLQELMAERGWTGWIRMERA